ncbi:hypothetical protein CRN84_13980 [Budvicia aquatica]|uniref:Uncharacterized protein n=1 Tax=Budvicia aquatica TaxID=82979 RepID=A0A2C6DNI7_9GAMM|nr:hypothetical protein CRN84_13980 [Budvicia aquatica]
MIYIQGNGPYLFSFDRHQYNHNQKEVISLLMIQLCLGLFIVKFKLHVFTPPEILKIAIY